MVLQAAVNGSDTAGVTSITLPTNYATYRDLTVVAWGNETDRIVQGEIVTAALAAQTIGRTIVLSGNFDATNASPQARGTWNPTTRVFAIQGSERILYASLTD